MFYLWWFVKDQFDNVGYEPWKMAKDEDADDCDGDSEMKRKQFQHIS